jgi:hypothetical protein
MREEMKEIVVDLHQARTKAEELQQANERLKWKLEDAQRRAAMATPPPAAARTAGGRGGAPPHSTPRQGGGPGRGTPHGAAAAAGRRQQQTPVQRTPGGGGARRHQQTPKPRLLERLDLHQAASAGKPAEVKALLQKLDADGAVSEKERGSHAHRSTPTQHAGGRTRPKSRAPQPLITCAVLTVVCGLGLLQPLWPVNGLNQERETPLHWAASRGHAKVVKLLLRHHADPRMKDKWGHTAAAQALNMGHYAISDLLEEVEEQVADEEERAKVETPSWQPQPPAPAPQLQPRQQPQQQPPPPSAGDVMAGGDGDGGDTLTLTVSHNLGEPLDMTLPRDTSFAGLQQLLLDGLGAERIEQLLLVEYHTSEELPLTEAEWQLQTDPSVREPVLDIQAVLVADGGGTEPPPHPRRRAGESEAAFGRREQLEEIRSQVPLWSVADVTGWLRDVVQLPQYVDVFEEEEVDGELLLWLRETNLEEDLGIELSHHRQRICAQIDLLRPDSHNSALPAGQSERRLEEEEHGYDFDTYDAEDRAGVSTSVRSEFAQQADDIVRRFEQLQGIGGGAGDDHDDVDDADGYGAGDTAARGSGSGGNGGGASGHPRSVEKKKVSPKEEPEDFTEEDLKSELEFMAEQLRKQLEESAAKPGGRVSPSLFGGARPSSRGGAGAAVTPEGGTAAPPVASRLAAVEEGEAESGSPLVSATAAAAAAEEEEEERGEAERDGEGTAPDDAERNSSPESGDGWAVSGSGNGTAGAAGLSTTGMMVAAAVSDYCADQARQRELWDDVKLRRVLGAWREEASEAKEMQQPQPQPQPEEEGRIQEGMPPLSSRRWPGGREQAARHPRSVPPPPRPSEQLTVRLEGTGKLGIIFGEGGSTWPVISALSPSGLAASYPQIQVGMELAAVADSSGHSVSVVGMSFQEGTVRPMTPDAHLI